SHQLLRDDDVRGAGDGQQLGHALNECQKNDLQVTQGLLIPTKLPSFSRARAQRKAPTSGLSKKKPIVLIFTRRRPEISRFQSWRSTSRMARARMADCSGSLRVLAG